MPIAPSPRQPLHWLYASFQRSHAVVPAKRSRPRVDDKEWNEMEQNGNLASRPRVDDRECNEMQPNATDLKVSPRLATPDEANQGRNQSQLAQCLRVSGGPNEATVAPFPASTVGVNEAKQGQMGPGINPPHRSPARGSVVPCEGGNLASLSPTRHSSEGWNPGLRGWSPKRIYDRNETK